MSRQEAVEQYGRALRQGRKCHKDCVLRGRYPYPQVLDEILSEAMTAGQVELGVLEIPTEQITGTKTAGRRTAFSAGQSLSRRDPLPPGEFPPSVFPEV